MSPTGSHRARQRRNAGAKQIAVGLATLALVGGTGVAVSNLLLSTENDKVAVDCGSGRVRLAVDPKIAAVVSEATSDLSRWQDDGDCVNVTVTPVESASTAEDLARARGHGFAISPPNLWLPDSTTWLNLARETEDGAARLPGAAVSVATSPVVIAVSRDAAESQGWPDDQPTWQQLLAEPEADLRVAATDLERDAAGLASLPALTGGSADGLRTVTGRLTVPLLGDRSIAEIVAAGAADAAPSSEQQVVNANREDPSQALVASYDPDLGAGLDYPLVAVSTGDKKDDALTQRALDVVTSALLAEEAQGLLQEAGFRNPDGELGDGYGEADGVLPSEDVSSDEPPTGAEIRAATKDWSTAGRRTRLLVLVDRSGSMAEIVPGTDSSRADLAETSLRRLVEDSAPDSDMGLWTFTTGLRTENYAELVTTGPLDEPLSGQTVARRDALLRAINGLDPVIGGSTPLYDSVLAAFRNAQQGFAYGRFNAVVVITDGRNEDPGSITLTTLLDSLRLEYDGIRPVRIVTIAYGEDADVATLKRIADTTGGRSYEALTGDQVSAALATAIADL